MHSRIMPEIDMSRSGYAASSVCSP
jgi:hypothetical protein